MGGLTPDLTEKFERFVNDAVAKKDKSNRRRSDAVKTLDISRSVRPGLSRLDRPLPSP